MPYFISLQSSIDQIRSVRKTVTPRYFYKNPLSKTANHQRRKIVCFVCICRILRYSKLAKICVMRKMTLLSIRSSDIAFTMGAKGPLLEKAENYDGEIPLF